MPAGCYLELTPHCQNRCIGCFNVWKITQTKHVPSSPLSGEAWLGLVKDLANISIKYCVLTGGEPTLHQDFTEIIRGIDQLGITTYLLTNGMWNKPSLIVDTLTNLRHFGSMTISLHGATPQSHEKYTHKQGSFDTTVQNIRLATSRGIVVFLSFVITPWNLNEIAAVFDLSQELGCSGVVYNRYMGPHMVELDVDENLLRKAILDVEKIKYRNGHVKFGNCMPQCFSINSSRICGAATSFFVVDPWGNMRPCGHSSLQVGNLISDSLENLWYDSRLVEWRAHIPEMCNECAVVKLCGGGCRALAEIRGYDPMYQKPFNLLNFAYVSLLFTYRVGGLFGLFRKPLQKASNTLCKQVQRAIPLPIFKSRS